MANEKIQIEIAQTQSEFEALTDAGSAQVFNPSVLLISGVTEPDIRPDGVVTGYNILSPDVADTIAFSAFTAHVGGVLRSITAGTVGITRPGTDVAKVCSITVNSSGTVVEVEGTAAADTTFVAGRGVAGSAPYIPVGSIEIGQVRVTASAAAVVTSAEILQGGVYTERSMFPAPTINPVGLGIHFTEIGTQNAYVRFNEALDTRHTGDEPKGVWLQYSVPSFDDLPRGTSFTPAETSHSVSSVDTFDGPIGEQSSSLGAASFEVVATDGITDAFVAQKNKKVTVKFYPNRNASAHIVTQGTLGISRSYSPGQRPRVPCTVTADVASAEFR